MQQLAELWILVSTIHTLFALRLTTLQKRSISLRPQKIEYLDEQLFFKVILYFMIKSSWSCLFCGVHGFLLLQVLFSLQSAMKQ